MVDRKTFKNREEPRPTIWRQNKKRRGSYVCIFLEWAVPVIIWLQVLQTLHQDELEYRDEPKIIAQ